MARLPQPGGDQNVWGDILNDFLMVEHGADGTLRIPRATVQQLDNHANGSDPHAAASYAIMIGGGRRLYVQATQPTGMQEGDIWIDTSGI